MKNKYGREIRQGDFIVIASDHHLELGFFLNIDDKDNVFYFTLFDLANWDARIPPHRNHLKCCEGQCKIVKYSSTLLNEEYYDLYAKSIKILRQLKIKE